MSSGKLKAMYRTKASTATTNEIDAIPMYNHTMRFLLNQTNEINSQQIKSTALIGQDVFNIMLD